MATERGRGMSRPWMPLYIADYLGDTAHLSTIEHGAYLLLMMHYWQRGSLPDDDDRLARIAGSMRIDDWRVIRPTVQAFFHDGWKHKRIDQELAEAVRISSAGRIGGLASGQARKKRTIVERSLNDRPNDPPTKSEAPQPQPQIHDDGDVRARDPAFDLALAIGVIAGYPDASYWPPGWLSAPQRVRQMLEHGWKPEVMLTAARGVMARKRDGPPSSISYFERPFAKAHAENLAPLPKVEIKEPEKVVINGRVEENTRSGSVSAVARALASRGGVAGGQDSAVVFCLPARRLP